MKNLMIVNVFIFVANILMLIYNFMLIKNAITNCILEDIPKVKKVIRIERQMTNEQEDVTKVKKKARYLGR